MPKEEKNRGSKELKGYVIDISLLETKQWLGKYDSVTGKSIIEEVKTPVREILVLKLFHPSLGLTYSEGGREARRVADLIDAAEGDTVTLNEEQYERLRTAVTTTPIGPYEECGIVDRVLEAKETTLKAE